MAVPFSVYPLAFGPVFSSSASSSSSTPTANAADPVAPDAMMAAAPAAEAKRPRRWALQLFQFNAMAIERNKPIILKQLEQMLERGALGDVKMREVSGYTFFQILVHPDYLLNIDPVAAKTTITPFGDPDEALSVAIAQLPVPKGMSPVAWHQYVCENMDGLESVVLAKYRQMLS